MKENKEETKLQSEQKTMKITVDIPEDHKQFLEMIKHQDAAANLSEAVQWCIDSCMRIEKNYGDEGGHYDACYVAFHDIRKEGHPEFENK